MATRGAPGPFSISQLFPPSLALYLSFTTLGHSGTACESAWQAPWPSAAYIRLIRYSCEFPMVAVKGRRLRRRSFGDHQ